MPAQSSHTQYKDNMWSRVAVLVALTASCHGGLLGAGTGEGSCAAAPFRAFAVKWAAGCPASSPCCTEYGYCRGADEWNARGFRDCNGASNGILLPAEVYLAENAAAAAGDSSGLALLEVPAGGSVVAPAGAGLGGAFGVAGGSVVASAIGGGAFVAPAGAVLAGGALSPGGALLAGGALARGGAILAGGALAPGGAVLAGGALAHGGAVLAGGALAHGGAVLGGGALAHGGAILNGGAVLAANGAVLRGVHGVAGYGLGGYTLAGYNGYNGYNGYAGLPVF